MNLPCGNYVADYVLFTRTGLHIPVMWALFWVISTFVIRKKDDLMFGTNDRMESSFTTHAQLIVSRRLS